MENLLHQSNHFLSKQNRKYGKQQSPRQSGLVDVDNKNSKKAIYSYAKNKDTPTREKNRNLLSQDELNSNSGYLMPDKNSTQVKSMGQFAGKKSVENKKDMLSEDADVPPVVNQNFNKKKGLISFNKLRYL